MPLRRGVFSPTMNISTIFIHTANCHHAPKPCERGFITTGQNPQVLPPSPPPCPCCPFPACSWPPVARNCKPQAWLPWHGIKPQAWLPWHGIVSPSRLPWPKGIMSNSAKGFWLTPNHAQDLREERGPRSLVRHAPSPRPGSIHNVDHLQI